MSHVAPPPGPKTAGFVFELPRFRRGVLAYFASLSRRYPGPLLLIQVGPGAAYIPNHPDVVREMLVEKAELFVRKRWWGELLHLVGDGLLTSDETTWVPQRRRLNPAYRQRHGDVVAEATGDETQACADRWRRAPGATVDVQEDVKRTLLRSLVRIMFTPDVPVDEQRIIADLDVVLQYVSLRSQFIRQNLSFVGIEGWGDDRLEASLGRLNAFIYDVIDGCRTGRYASGLLLAALLPAEERGEVDATNIHDEVGTLLLAGFDTTAALVTFALWSLADRPDLCDAIRRESSQSEATTLEQVLRETLRLYPAVWAIHRTAGEPIELGGFSIPKGEYVMACPYAIQRNPAFWPDPDRFVPERFDDAHANDALLGFEYLPFSHGRHTCIGKRMALQQARLMVTDLVHQFDLARVGPLPRLIPGVILKASGGLPLRVTPR